MTINELIVLLKRIEGFGEAEVLAFDPVLQRYMPVERILYTKNENDEGVFWLKTDPEL